MRKFKSQYSMSVFIALTAIMSGLTTIATAIIIIPFPTSSGYLNFGDTMVMLSGMLLGPLGGFIAGGFGSAFADVALGYLAFAPLTFVVKGMEGMVIGLICRKISRFRKLTIRDAMGLIAGGLTMMTGYFLGEIVLLGYEAAVAELLFLNWIQASVGIIFAAIVGPTVRSYLAQTSPSDVSTSSDFELEDE